MSLDKIHPGCVTTEIASGSRRAAEVAPPQSLECGQRGCDAERDHHGCGTGAERVRGQEVTPVARIPPSRRSGTPVTARPPRRGAQPAGRRSPARDRAVLMHGASPEACQPASRSGRARWQPRVQTRRECRSAARARDSTSAGAHLADLSSDVESATGPRWASLSGLTIELMALIWPSAISSAITPISRCCASR